MLSSSRLTISAASRSLVSRACLFQAAPKRARMLLYSDQAVSGQRIPTQWRQKRAHWVGTRNFSSSVLDLDDLLAKNKYGGEEKSAGNTSSLEALMGKNRYGGANSTLRDVKDISPEYPHDLDVGPLFCVKADRCFLDGGKRCGQYQSGNRNKGMLQDLYTACKETGFFFVHSTLVEAGEVKQVYSHMSDLDRGNPLWELEPRADRAQGRRGFFPVHQHADSDGLAARHGGFSMARPMSTRGEGNAWPASPEGFREDVEGYYKQMDLLAQQLLAAFASVCGLPPNTFQDLRSAESASELHLLQFPASPPPSDPPSPQDPAEAGFRTEPGVLCIFNQSEPTLQVIDLEGKWCNVRVGTDRFVVLLGDALEHLSNGEFPATKFRVLPAKHERQAMKYAARLDPDASVAPLPDFG
eukprot:CAMPEP_0181323888 /NCGR_PEP_ID=MMETSP1101-20121128/20045_1 /TAXON_ID=46948 /ORGANISM="Rhodomonas abbreviata, Strain Caron Lab Isolate" /LENGTH=411 /DNA_ID=CAMNT_0023431985 /DNA_START=71 /DNA_END=1302 /DNA_ORIENTATION=+